MIKFTQSKPVERVHKQTTLHAPTHTNAYIIEPPLNHKVLLKTHSYVLRFPLIQPKQKKTHFSCSWASLG